MGMFLDKKEDTLGKNRKLAVAGYDLTNQTAQISCMLPGESKPETMSLVAGSEDYNIPAVLLKRQKLWLYGRDAMVASKEEGVLLTDLLENAVHKKETEIDGEVYEGTALLSLFIRRSLSVLYHKVSPDRLGTLVFTLENTDKETVEALAEAVSKAALNIPKIYFINRAESFFYYNISQPKELWQREVVIADFSGERMKFLRFFVNKNTTPIASFVDETAVDLARSLDQEPDERRGRLFDEKFCSCILEETNEKDIGTVYLIGDGFLGGWFKESLKLLCQDRRVFMGNNLYSKGAAYAARERLNPGEISGKYAFLGRDMLKTNLGMHVKKAGQDSYLALLDAGQNWYEAESECDFILEDADGFSLQMVPLNGGTPTELKISLAGLPVRPKGTTRIHLKVWMKEAGIVVISARDMGFGELYPATDQVWEETFSLL